MQIAAREKKQKTQTIISLLTKIHHLETQNKKDASQALIEELKERRLELKKVLINDYEIKL